MKTSVLSNNSITGPQQASLFPALRGMLRTFLGKLDKIGTAIALGESGDLDGAHALRTKHAK